jgi:tail protein
VTVLLSTPVFTSVTFKGLDSLILPWRAHILEGLDDSSFNKALADNEDKYYVKTVTGLEPPEREVAIARTASGGKFQGVTSVDREVVVLIGLNPDWEAGETPKILRDNLYTMLFTGYDPRVDIQLNAGPFPVAHEFAYVTKFEAAIFDANPAVQITFTCLNPTFRAFSKASYAPGDLSEKAPDVYNYGTAETGFQFAVKFSGTMNGWYIKQAGNQSVGMVFDMTFHDGDLLSVSTIPGQKYVHWRKHRGKVQNKLSILTGGSEWIQLHPGHNHFVVPKKTSAWDWNGKLTFLPQFAGA